MFYGREVLAPVVHSAATVNEARGAAHTRDRSGRIGGKLHLLAANSAASSSLPAFGSHALSALEAELKRIESSFDAPEGCGPAAPAKPQRAPNQRHKRDAGSTSRLLSLCSSPRRAKAVRGPKGSKKATEDRRSADTAEQIEAAAPAPATPTAPVLPALVRQPSSRLQGSKPPVARAKPTNTPSRVRRDDFMQDERARTQLPSARAMHARAELVCVAVGVGRTCLAAHKRRLR
jgi:hypothetical protein